MRLTAGEQSLFKNLPELLKNRQSARNRAYLKRPAPADQTKDGSALQARPSEVASVPASKRQNTLSSTPAISKPTQSEPATATPMSLDDGRSYNSTPPSWVARTPDFTNETPFPIASQAFTGDQGDQPPDASSYQPLSQDSALQYSQALQGSGLPDLMPIMFPSEDPFAYPMQPMSTLEDDHFRNGQGAPFGQYTFGSASQQSSATPTPSLASSMNTPRGSIALSTSGFENFNIPAFPNSISPTVSAPLQQNQSSSSNQSQQRHSHSQSHGSITANANGETTEESPDLVSIPDHNFVFQSYSFPPQIAAPDQSNQMQAPTAAQGFNDIGMDGNTDNSVTTGFDLNNINLDDIFGNASSRPTGSVATEDWSQWMV